MENQKGKRSSYIESNKHKPKSRSLSPSLSQPTSQLKHFAAIKLYNLPEQSIFQSHYQALNFRSTEAASPHPPTPSAPNPVQHIFRYTRFYLFICVQYVCPMNLHRRKWRAKRCGEWRLQSGKCPNPTHVSRFASLADPLAPPGARAGSFIWSA